MLFFKHIFQKGCIMSNERPLQNRRLFLKSSGLFILGSIAGCSMDSSLPRLDRATTGSIFSPSARNAIRPPLGVDPAFTPANIMYAPISERGFELQGIPYKQVPRKYQRQIVSNQTGEAPGTIVVDTKNYFLYFIQDGAEAIRYGVGVGRTGFSWSGRAKVQYKREWPVWTPPAEMIGRQPELVQYKNGMHPGPENPLGARALYIYQNDNDTGYRIHGSPEWWSIGKSMSSGCIRLINQDIIDLFARVPVGAPIVVI